MEKEVARPRAVTKQQSPVYFMSEVLPGSKKYYSEVEKICYVVIMCSRKLWHYFEAHHIRVLTNQHMTSFATRTGLDELANGQQNSQNTSSISKGTAQ
jgi:hypothetical protein